MHCPLSCGLFYAHKNDFSDRIISRKNRLEFGNYSDHSAVKILPAVCWMVYLTDKLRKWGYLVSFYLDTGATSMKSRKSSNMISDFAAVGAA